MLEISIRNSNRDVKHLVGYISQQFRIEVWDEDSSSDM